MPLTLVTGPANAAKAGEVFGRLRAARRSDPLLVVPTGADAAHYRRELALAGLVLGPEVVTFEGLVRELARCTGSAARPVGRLARERLVAAAVAAAPLQRLAASAASPGFAAAAGELFAELRLARATPDRFRAALRAWAANDAGRSAYAAEVAGLYAAYDERLQALGRPDPEQHAWDVLTALRLAPRAWNARPVAFYGWDDLSPVQIDAVETLAGPAEAPVTLSLAYEPGRAAFAARTGLVERLRPQAAEHIVLEPLDDHYADRSRAALHHLERELFGAADGARPERIACGDAVALLEAGGERAEAELVGAEVLAALAGGDVAPEEIAVVLRAPQAERAAFADVLAGLGVPIAAGGTVALEDTAQGAGLLALARAARPSGTARDVLRWLRTPGRLPQPELADELERRIRRGEVTSAAAARRVWEADHGPLAELDRLAAAAAAGHAELLTALQTEIDAVWAAPYTRAAAILDADGQADAQLVARLGRDLADLRDLADAAPDCLGTADELVVLLGRLRVPAPQAIPPTPRAALAGASRPALARAEPAAPVAVALGGRDQPTSAAVALGGGVLVADPSAIRGRRFRIVVVCGLQEQVFPRPAQPDPFLDDVARRELASASGLVLPVRGDGQAQERFLFYACVSRPTDRLVLAFRSSDEEGGAQLPSPFVDDVRSLFDDGLWTRRGRRLLADVAWPPAAAPSVRELSRALQVRPAAEPAALGPPVTEPVRALIAARESESARGLEAFGSCGVRWLVERLLRPKPIDPDEEALRRGGLAHRAMERTLVLLRERTGSARITGERLDAVLSALHDALAGMADEPALRRGGPRARILLRELEVELARAIRVEAETGPGFEPTHLEWSFGGGEDDAPGLEIGGLRISGRVDRIDQDATTGEALIRDYKGANVTPGAKWADERRIQAVLYLLAAQRELGLRAAGAVYQPLRKGKPARGLVRSGSALADRGTWTRTDVVDANEFDQELASLTQLAEDLAEALRRGEIRPCPERCGFDGCAYPTICRASGA